MTSPTGGSVLDGGDLSGQDEVPLWSAPFALALLEAVSLRPGMTVLDLGSGTGVPAVEVAERLGRRGLVVGVDPSPGPAARARAKARSYGAARVFFLRAVGEGLPLRAGCVDLVMSNNGLNNVADLAASLRECRRVCRPQAHLALTMNLEGTMGLLYDELRGALAEAGLGGALPRVEAHIRRKRPPLPEVQDALRSAGFSLSSERRGAFAIRFVDAEALFGHHLIRRGFLPAWREIPPADRIEELMTSLARRLDAIARDRGELRLEVPFVCLTAVAAER